MAATTGDDDDDSWFVKARVLLDDDEDDVFVVDGVIDDAAAGGGVATGVESGRDAGDDYTLKEIKRIVENSCKPRSFRFYNLK